MQIRPTLAVLTACKLRRGRVASRPFFPDEQAVAGGAALMRQLRLRYIDRLTQAGFTQEHAGVHADALDEALREAVATRTDVARLEQKFEVAVPI